MPVIRRGLATDVASVIDVLIALPVHFTPETHQHVSRAIDAGAAFWVAIEEPSVVGFLLAEQRFATSVEFTHAGVLPSAQGTGIGTALVTRAMRELADDDITMVLVKTLDASSGYEPYVATRAFWEARGFVQIDMIDPLPGWEPGNPSALYVAWIGASARPEPDAKPQTNGGARLTTVNLSSAEPRRTARFYAELLSWKVESDESVWATARPLTSGVGINVQYETHYERPVWPTERGAQQMMAHLEIGVTDLSAATQAAIELGATQASFQPQQDVRVMLDPDGHPFCLWQMGASGG